MDKFNFIFLIPNRAFGGLEIQMVKRADDALTLGHNTIFISHPGSRSELLAKESNIRTESIEIKSRYIDIPAIVKLGKLMRKNKTHICVVGKTDYLSQAILARNIFSRKTVIIFYQQLESIYMKKDLFHNWVYRNLDVAVVLTQIMKDALPEYTIFDKSKIEVIPYGLDLNLFNPDKHNKLECRKKFNLPEDKLLIGVPGRISEAKGQHIAIEALKKSNLKDVLLVFCGDKVVAWYDEIMSRATELDIADKIIHIPFTNDMPEFMNAMDISILPSKREAFGLVVTEAMASGLPVIATNAGGVPELIQHDKNGQLFEPFDSDTLAQYLKLLVENPQLRAKLGKQARFDAESRYDYSVQSEKFFNFAIEVYNKKNFKTNRN